MSKSEVEGFLTRHKACFWGEDSSIDAVEMSQAVFEEMRHWVDKTDKRDMWIHESHLDAERPFGLGLYPRLSLTAAGVFTGPGMLTRISMDMSELAWHGLRLLPGVGHKIADRPIFLNSSIGLFWSPLRARTWDSWSWRLHELGVIFRSYRGKPQSWYGGLGYARATDGGDRLLTTVGGVFGLGFPVNLSLDVRMETDLSNDWSSEFTPAITLRYRLPWPRIGPVHPLDLAQSE